MFKDRKVLYSVFVVAGIILGVSVFLYFSTGNGSVNNAKNSLSNQLPKTSIYTNNDFRVSFEYPSTWKSDSSGKKLNNSFLSFKGDGGFFLVGALVGQGNISDLESIPMDKVARSLGNSPIEYGSKPAVSTTTLAGMDAAYIFPSADQPAGANKKATVIVRYPKVLAIGSTTLPFFILDADKSDLETIAKTLKFVNF